MPQDPFQDRVPFLVYQATKLYRSYADAMLQSTGITTATFPVLKLLRDGKTLTQKELVMRWGIEQSSMAVMLRRLEDNGLIIREKDPDDGRRRLVRLSDKAQSLLVDVDEILTTGDALSTEGFSDADIAMLKTLLGRLLGNLETMGEFDGPCV